MFKEEVEVMRKDKKYRTQLGLKISKQILNFLSFFRNFKKFEKNYGIQILKLILDKDLTADEVYRAKHGTLSKNNPLY